MKKCLISSMACCVGDRSWRIGLRPQKGQSQRSPLYRGRTKCAQTDGAAPAAAPATTEPAKNQLREDGHGHSGHLRRLGGGCERLAAEGSDGARDTHRGSFTSLLSGSIDRRT